MARIHPLHLKKNQQIPALGGYPLPQTHEVLLAPFVIRPEGQGVHVVLTSLE